LISTIAVAARVGVPSSRHKFQSDGTSFFHLSGQNIFGGQPSGAGDAV
jgi:hypothetical protein